MIQRRNTLKVKRKFFALVTALVLVVASAAAGGGRTHARQGPYPGETWQVARRPEQIGWSSAKLEAARVFSERIGTAAVVIVDDGIIVEQWGGVASKYPIHSIRKPLMSALVGIHVHENRIDLSRTLEQLEIDDIGPPLTRAEKQATVADLLRSRSGVYHPALGEVDAMKQLRPARGSHPPGTFWYYNNWDFNAVGTIFEQETGTRIFEEFIARIARPLQMADFSLGQGKYIGGAASIHRVYAFRMSARDLARFGLLYLRRGRWNDRQLVPANWVRQSTATYSDIGRGQGYGYMWRTAVGAGLVPNVYLKRPCFFHSGLGVHFLVVMPHRHLVLVHRVNTDARGPYPPLHQIGRLFWMILDAAGETDIGHDPSMAAAPGVRLRGAALTTALLAGSYHVHLPTRLIEGGDRVYTLRFRKNRALCLTSPSGDLETGRWRTTDIGCCLEMGPATGCYAVFKDAETLRWYDATNTLFKTIRLRDFAGSEAN